MSETPLNVPPKNWHHIWVDKNKKWSPFVLYKHIEDYAGPSFNMFVKQFGSVADVDNITVRARREALKALLPDGTVTVTAAQAVSPKTPKGWCLLLSSPGNVFVKETDKQALLDAACSDEFPRDSSFSGNESKKVVFSGETFTPEQIFLLLDMADVKFIHFVSFAMKGSLPWAHRILKNIQTKMEEENQSYAIQIDFAVTIPPQFCHFSQKGTHQCPRHDPTDRSQQFVPLAMVTRENAVQMFGTETITAHFPQFMDAQFSQNPTTPPLFGGVTIHPKATKSDTLERYLWEEEDSSDEDDENPEELRQSPHCDLYEVNKLNKMVIYPTYPHLSKQYVGRGKADITSGVDTVREASRVVNKLSRFAAHAIGGGIKTALRLEASIEVSKDHFFTDYSESSTDGNDPPDSLLKQFGFAFVPLWKAFHILRINFVSHKAICESMLRYYIFVTLAPLPVHLQIMSGSSDVDQVGHRLPPQKARYYGSKLAKGDSMVLGDGKSRDRDREFYGKVTLPPRKNSRQSDELDESWEIGHDDDNGDRRLGRTQGRDNVADAVETRAGGRLSRNLTENQKCFFALYCANCGSPNKLANKLLARQFGSGATATDNSFLWIMFQVWAFYIQVLQDDLSQGAVFTERQLKNLLVGKLLPSAAPLSAEAGDDGVGMHLCQPPAVSNMRLHLYGRKSGGEYPSIMIGMSHSSCLTVESFWSTLWLLVCGGSALHMYQCPLSQMNTADISATVSDESVLTDNVLVAEVRYYANFKQMANGKFRLSVAKGKEKAGAQFCAAATVEDCVKRAAAFILSPRPKFDFINKDNWKSFLNIKDDIEELSADELYLRERNLASAETQAMAWRLKKIETILAAVLSVHRIQHAAEKSYFWAAYNVCSTPLMVRNTGGNVIRAVAKKIIEDENLSKNWPSKLQTEVPPQNIAWSNEEEQALYQTLRSSALCERVYDGDTNLGIFCTRFNPGISWERPFAIGRTKKLCLIKSVERFFNEYSTDYTEWNDVILSSEHGSVPYNIDSVFLLRPNFRLSLSGYDNSQWQVDQPGEVLYAPNFDESALHIVPNSDSAPMDGGAQHPVGSDDSEKENSDSDGEDDPSLSWEPHLHKASKIARSRSRAEQDEDLNSVLNEDTVHAAFSPSDDAHNVIPDSSGPSGVIVKSSLPWFTNFLESIQGLVDANRLIIEPIDSHQGKHIGNLEKDSSNGCSCISALSVLRHLQLQTDSGLSVDDYIQIMDNVVPPLLLKIRSRFEIVDGFASLHESYQVINEEYVPCPQVNFHGTVGGNILDESTLHRLCKAIEEHELEKVGASLYVAKHSITILKSKDSVWYNVYESLPVLGDSSKGNARCIRIMVSDAWSLQQVLLHYGWHKIASNPNISMQNLSKMDFDEQNENDPRLFEAHIYYSDLCETGTNSIGAGSADNDVLDSNGEDIMEGDNAGRLGDVVGNEGDDMILNEENQGEGMGNEDEGRILQTPMQGDANEPDFRNAKTLLRGTRGNDDSIPYLRMSKMRLEHEFDGIVSTPLMDTPTSVVENNTPAFFKVPNGPIRVHAYVHREDLCHSNYEELDDLMAMFNMYEKDSRNEYEKFRQESNASSCFEAYMQLDEAPYFMHCDVEDSNTSIRTISNRIMSQVKDVPTDIDTLCYGTECEGKEGTGRDEHMILFSGDDTIADIVSSYGQLYDPQNQGNCGIFLVIIYSSEKFSQRVLEFHDKLSAAFKQCLISGKSLRDAFCQQLTFNNFRDAFSACEKVKLGVKAGEVNDNVAPIPVFTIRTNLFGNQQMGETEPNESEKSQGDLGDKEAAAEGEGTDDHSVEDDSCGYLTQEDAEGVSLDHEEPDNDQLQKVRKRKLQNEFLQKEKKKLCQMYKDFTGCEMTVEVWEQITSTPLRISQWSEIWNGEQYHDC